MLAAGLACAPPIFVRQPNENLKFSVSSLRYSCCYTQIIGLLQWIKHHQTMCMVQRLVSLSGIWIRTFLIWAKLLKPKCDSWERQCERHGWRVSTADVGASGFRCAFLIEFSNKSQLCIYIPPYIIYVHFYNNVFHILRKYIIYMFWHIFTYMHDTVCFTYIHSFITIPAWNLELDGIGYFHWTRFGNILSILETIILTCIIERTRSR